MSARDEQYAAILFALAWVGTLLEVLGYSAIPTKAGKALSSGEASGARIRPRDPDGLDHFLQDRFVERWHAVVDEIFVRTRAARRLSLDRPFPVDG